jgi:CubicO group peptidase (beta-lactamase class C family)
LAERKQLDLSDLVAKFLPDYPNGEKLRLVHLLNHTSGIPNTGSLPEWSTEERKPHTTAELVAVFKDKPLVFEPGARTSYSNSNYNLLALIIEKVSGQSYGDFLRQNIFSPLSLSDTLHHGAANQLIVDRASGIEPDGVHGVRYPRYVDWSAFVGSGSLVTTARDLDKFVTAVFTGKLLTPQSLSILMEPADGFAYGWLRDERFGRKQMRAGGRVPGFSISVERYLDDGTNVIVLSNSYSPVAQDSVFLNGLHSATFGKPSDSPVILAIPVKSGSLSQYAGRYQLPNNYFVPDAMLTFTERGDHFDVAWSSGGLNTVFPVANDKFLDRNYWARITFTRDAIGSVTGFEYEIADQKFKAVRLSP